jgi:GAF domain-containing protein
MPFAAGLRDLLELRDDQVPVELANGESLKDVLSKHLTAVEAASASDVITSILLLSADGKRLYHGAGPRLPQSYCDAIDGSDIGPRAGSCGTAAYYGSPVYVSDIASNPLWTDYRHIALPHGLRSCWSTPIPDQYGNVIGTFAVYRPVVGDPSEEVVRAIKMITEHVARAITMARNVQERARSARRRAELPRLKLVVRNEPEAIAKHHFARLLELAGTMESKAAALDIVAETTVSQEELVGLRKAAELCRGVAETIRSKMN